MTTPRAVTKRNIRHPRVLHNIIRGRMFVKMTHHKVPPEVTHVGWGRYDGKT